MLKYSRRKKIKKKLKERGKLKESIKEEGGVRGKEINPRGTRNSARH
jgi:hypothetical protein